MKITIVEVAKEANVSVTTVSKILNNKAENIRQDTIDRVMKAIEILNYTPNMMARSLITKKTQSIGLVLPDISNSYFSSIASGLEYKANECGYNVIFCNTDDKRDKEEECIKLLKDKFVDGIILIPTLLSSIEEIKKDMGSAAFVLVDRVINPDEKDVKCVYVDNVYGGYIATKFLIENGHKRIACITGRNTEKSTKDRLEGFLKAMDEANLAVDETNILEGNYRFSGGKKCAEQLLYKNIDAVFVQNDLMTCGVYNVFQEAGRIIPRDVSVIGYDNVDYARILTPALTTVSQPYREMGRVAAEIIIDEVEGRKVAHIAPFIPELVVRNSVAVIE